MKKNILFIQGGGNGGYEADEKLAASLQRELGSDYRVSYPQITSDELCRILGGSTKSAKKFHPSKEKLFWLHTLLALQCC